ncbi:MAG: sulfotransferase domain-containing protein [Euryarchaeota archaeon]|nr:sulfotransferase domain-containing protein [Euryarchaeota archaeon]
MVTLDKTRNYIVSGLERSGTSLLMQMLHAGNIPTASDTLRPADEHNPKGYFELEGGKIINRLMEKTFSMEKCKGVFIKITAYGLQFLPPGKYTIIYSERNLDEIMDSMEKMTKTKDTNPKETKESFRKLNALIKKQIESRNDIQVMFVNYNDIISQPEHISKKIIDFLGCTDVNVQDMFATVDKNLYRQRQKTTENTP